MSKGVISFKTGDECLFICVLLPRCAYFFVSIRWSDIQSVNSSLTTGDNFLNLRRH